MVSVVLLLDDFISYVVLYLGVASVSPCIILIRFEDFGWTKFAPSDPEKMKKKKASEMLNGRLAMCAVGGIATQSVITGHGFPYI